MRPENKVSIPFGSTARILKIVRADPDASYVNNDTAFASRPLASRVLSTATVTTQTQKARRVPSSSSINNAAGYSLAPEPHTGSSRAAEAGSSRDILSGLTGYKQERERAASRMTDRTAGSDKGRERQAGDRPGSALSNHSRPEQRRTRDGERESRVGEAGRRHQGTNEKPTTPSDAASEAERIKRRDKDRYPGLQTRDRPDADRRADRDAGKTSERYTTREQGEDRSRGTRRPGSSAPETPVTEDGSSAAQRDTLRPPLSSHDTEERDLLSEVPLAVQEAWICEDLGFVLQVRRLFRSKRRLDSGLSPAF
jgi:hypothetical protein